MSTIQKSWFDRLTTKCAHYLKCCGAAFPLSSLYTLGDHRCDSRGCGSPSLMFQTDIKQIIWDFCVWLLLSIVLLYFNPCHNNVITPFVCVVCAYVHMWTHAWGGEINFMYNYSETIHFVFEMGSFIDLELTEWARLPDHQDPEIRFSLLLYCWYCKMLSPFGFLYEFWGSVWGLHVYEASILLTGPYVLLNSFFLNVWMNLFA